MKRKFVQIAALCLSVVLLAVSGGRQSASATSQGTSGRTIRVGLHHDGPYGTGSMEGLNLANGTGSGFRFGYYDSSNQFTQLGFTRETEISVVKTMNVYYGTYNGYKSYHSALTSSGVAVGDYHLELSGTYSTFKEAQAAADYEGGFPAWIGGEYFARIGNYTTEDQALAAQAYWAERGVETVLKGTSEYGVSVVITGTNTILFQFDDLGKGTGLGVEPNAADIGEDNEPDHGEDDKPDHGEDDGPVHGEDDPEDSGENNTEENGEGNGENSAENNGADSGENGAENNGADSGENSAENNRAANSAENSGENGTQDNVKYTTWSKNCLYYGGFRFERIGGGNMTVVNILGLEDYVKGVVPHEMSNSWPREALKAQAVAARSYALSLGVRHSGSHFDICNDVHCQAYSGLTRAGSNSDAAVDETAGQVILYNNKVAQAYYYSSNGGASESVSVVWGSNQANYPYLVGKADPYEADSGVRNDYTRTVSSATLVAGLKKLGYNDVGSSIVSVAIVSLTDAGNPKQITFTDNNGTRFTVDSRFVKDMVGLSSYRYGLASASAPAPEVSVTGGNPVDSSSLYAIDGDGNVAPVAGDVYVLTGSGTVKLEQGGAGAGDPDSGGLGSLSSATAVNGSFTFIGKGWGHNVGMSQYGAYAMAKQGKNYLEILQFYYTGITVGFM